MPLQKRIVCIFEVFWRFDRSGSFFCIKDEEWIRICWQGMWICIFETFSVSKEADLKIWSISIIILLCVNV